MQELEPRILLSGSTFGPGLSASGPVAEVLDLKLVADKRLIPVESPAMDATPLVDKPHRARVLGINQIANGTEGGNPATLGFDVWDSSWWGPMFQYDEGFISFTLSGTATYGIDYVASADNTEGFTNGVTGTLHIEKDSPATGMGFDILSDNLVEGNETVIITLTGFSADGTAGGWNTMNITDDPPKITVDPTESIPEYDFDSDAAGTMNLGFTRSGGDFSQPLTISFTPSGTATQDVDYTLNTQTLTIGAGQGGAQAVLTAIPDSEIEDTETVVVTVPTTQNYLGTDQTQPAYVLNNAAFLAGENQTQGGTTQRTANINDTHFDIVWNNSVSHNFTDSQDHAGHTQQGSLITGATITVEAGEQISLTTTAAQRQNATFQWTVPDKVVGGYTATTTSAQMLSYSTDKQANTTFYWLDGSPAGVTKQVQVKVTLPGWTSTYDVTFKVLKPKLSAMPNNLGVQITQQGTGGIQPDGPNQVAYWDPTSEDPDFAPKDGKPVATAGMKIEVPRGITNFNGKQTFVQTVSTVRTNTDANGQVHTQQTIHDAQNPANNEWVLDTEYPYLAMDPQDHATWVFRDSPSLGWIAGDKDATLDDNFRTYGFYTPKSAGAIPVPIWKVTWGWSVHVTLTNGVMTIVPGSKSVDNYVYDNTVTDLPEWTRNITSIPFNPAR